MQAKMPEESGLDFHVNAHRVRFVPPDIIRIWWNGQCTREDFDGVLDFGHRHMGQRPYFVLADLSKMKGADADARKFVATDPRNRNIVRLALIRATFHTEVIAKMVTRAIEFFNGEQRGRVRFFGTEAEALVWIADERGRLGLGRVSAHENHED